MPINLRRSSTIAPKQSTRPPKGRTTSSAQIGREMRAELSATLSEVMLTAADAIEASCPIRTGNLLANFILATGSPHQGVEGSPEAVSYAAQDAGREKVLKYDVGRDGKIFITNHVDYLQYQRPFVTEALMSGAAAAPLGRQASARKMLKGMARAAFKKGA